MRNLIFIALPLLLYIFLASCLYDLRNPTVQIYVHQQTMQSVNHTFYRIEDGRILNPDGRLYLLVGANYWQAMNLGMEDEKGGNRTRVLQDLARLRQSGVNNVRVMASSEGPDTEPYRMKPSLMPKPGEYNEDVFVGLDWFLAQLEEFHMTVTMTLQNYWHWSGGFCQVVQWADPAHPPIPYPTSRDFDPLVRYCGRFYTDPAIYSRTQEIYHKHVHTVLNRVNTVNGRTYKDDPTIFAWELANEPQAVDWLEGADGKRRGIEIVRRWIEQSTQFIKSIDPQHLLTTGAEGKNGREWFFAMHDIKEIDYSSAHVWVENWGEYNSTDATEENYRRAESFMLDFVQNVSDWSTALNKPVYLAEYGMARDGWTSISKYDPSAPVTNRNRYYKSLMDKVLSLERRGVFAGQAFWAYAGLARPSDRVPQWLGDPPHEPQGWYSVYDKDKETLDIIADHAKDVARIVEGRQ